MDNPNLPGDESVIYQSQKIIIGGARCELLLTGKRLILAESDTGTISENLPYTVIEHALPDFNRLREPVIILTLPGTEGTSREIELIFVYQPAGQNIQDRDKCLAVLRAQSVPTGDSLHRAIPPPSQMRKDNAEATADGEDDNVRPAVPEWTIFGTSRYTRKQAKGAAPQQQMSPLFTIIAAVLVIGLLVGGVIIAFQLVLPKMVPVNTTEPTQETVATESLSPTPTLAAEATATPEQVTPSVTSTIPLNGIWIQVSYPGNFSGSVGAEGWMTAVNGSGTRQYLLPIHDTVIEGTIEKQDGSADTLDLGVYNGGVLVSDFTTSKPWGSIELDLPIGPAVMNGPVTATEAPTIATPPTPDSSLVLHEVPLSGVWVRVAYPGNFTGSITTNGIAEYVNSSGDQFFQFPMTGGTIDGFLSKGDGSVNNMVVQVYKDGTLVTYGNTSAPLGTVEIHTGV
jgi:hypothetical protein